MKIEGIELANPNDYGGMCSRDVVWRGEKDFTAGIETIATTSAPTLVADWERMQVVREILPMKYAQLPEGDKVPLLDTHSRGSIEEIKGSARNWTTSDSELLCKCFISEAETSIRQKITEGHLDSVSIGYQTDKKQTVEIPKDKTVSVNGEEFKNDFADGRPLVVRTWWKIRELSLVPIGADSSAKFRGEKEKQVLEEIEDLRAQLEQIRKEITTGKHKSFYERKLRLINSKLKLN